MMFPEAALAVLTMHVREHIIRGMRPNVSVEIRRSKRLSLLFWTVVCHVWPVSSSYDGERVE